MDFSEVKERNEKAVKCLCDVLLDVEANLADRDDAAMDLGEFNEDLALEVLCKVASNSSEDETLLASCGESAAQIWLRRGFCNVEVLKQFQQVAMAEALALIRTKNPSLLSGILGE